MVIFQIAILVYQRVDIISSYQNISPILRWTPLIVAGTCKRYSEAGQRSFLQCSGCMVSSHQRSGGGFHKWGYPRMVGWQGQIQLKWMIWRHPQDLLCGCVLRKLAVGNTQTDWDSSNTGGWDSASNQTNNLQARFDGRPSQLQNMASLRYPATSRCTSIHWIITCLCGLPRLKHVSKCHPPSTTIQKTTLGRGLNPPWRPSCIWSFRSASQMTLVPSMDGLKANVAGHPLDLNGNIYGIYGFRFRISLQPIHWNKRYYLVRVIKWSFMRVERREKNTSQPANPIDDVSTDTWNYLEGRQVS